MALPNSPVKVFPGKEASASNYNLVLDNVTYLDNELTTEEQRNASFDQYITDQTAVHNSIDSRLSTLESAPTPPPLRGGAWTTTGTLPSPEGRYVWVWNSEVDAPSGITLQSGGTDFLPDAGVWQIDVSLQIDVYAGSPGWYLWFEYGDQRDGWAKSGGAYLSQNIRFSRRFDGVEKFKVAMFLGTGGTPPTFIRSSVPPLLHAYRIGD